jgi:5-methylcytosine-specific restriction endonuclease McrA
VLSSCKRYRRDNPDMAIKWRQANKEQKAEYARRYRRDNLEALSESGKDYNKKNRDLRNALKARRKAYKLKATPEWLTEEQDNKIKMYYKIAKALEKMDGVKRHVDHIVPLKGKGVRGLHVPWNLQILTAEANLSKNNSYSNWD